MFGLSWGTDHSQYAVTGAAHGMALQISKSLAERGAIVSMADVNEQGLKQAMKLLEGDKHIYSVVDVRNSKSVDN